MFELIVHHPQLKRACLSVSELDKKNCFSNLQACGPQNSLLTCRENIFGSPKSKLKDPANHAQCNGITLKLRILHTARPSKSVRRGSRRKKISPQRHREHQICKGEEGLLERLSAFFRVWKLLEDGCIATRRDARTV